jgi:hypothetical protein
MADSAGTAPAFFTVGGTLRVQDRSYVSRLADRVLEEKLRAGMFCTVLTARQMGKSSLMVRTARRLSDQGTRCAVVDLTAIGTKVAADGWYLGVLAPIRNQLRLTVDLPAWWAEHSAMGSSERFATFLRDVALAQADTPLVIFVDEIDTTLALDTQLRDDFFIAIRAIANERANTANSPFTRLTFAFFGVATPDDLVGDRRRTAFNIGAQIELDDLSLKDAAPLLAGLDRAHSFEGMSILWQIFAWTGGHPYLTQKLCAAAARASFDPKDERAINQLVRTEVLDEGANDDNLAFIRNRISSVSSDEQRGLLALYSRVLRGEGVADDETSIVQNRLELTGLIKVVDGRLVVRNPIYRTAFDDAWVRTAMPRNDRQRLATASVIMAVLVVLAVGLGLRWFSSTDEDARALALANGFMTTVAKTPSADTPADDRQRLDSLDQLLQLQHDQAAYREQALQLFYDRLDFDQQQKLFIYGDTGDGSKLIRVATAIVATLGPEDDGSDLAIINAVIKGLDNVQGNPSNSLALQFLIQLRQRLMDNNPTAAQEQLAVFSLPSNSTILGTAALPAPAYAFDVARTWTIDTSADTSRALAALQSMLDSAAIQPTPLPVTATTHASDSAPVTASESSALSATDVVVEGSTSGVLPPTPDSTPTLPRIRGKGLIATHRLRNLKEINQTIQDFIRDHPVLLQELVTRQNQYIQLADLLGVRNSLLVGTNVQTQTTESLKVTLTAPAIDGTAAAQTRTVEAAQFVAEAVQTQAVLAIGATAAAQTQIALAIGATAAAQTQIALAIGATAAAQTRTVEIVQLSQTPSPRALSMAVQRTSTSNTNSRCINVRLILPTGFSGNGWRLVEDGLGRSASFNTGGFAGLCVSADRQEFTFSILPPSGIRVSSGNNNIPARGGDNFNAFVQ